MPEIEDSIILADMSQCLPADSLSRDKKEGCWRLIDYETEDGLKGIMAFGDPELGAGQIELPLNVEGPYRIHLGINYTKTCHGDLLHFEEWSLYGQIEVKLSDDVGFTRVAAEQPSWGSDKFPSKLGKGKLINRSVQDTFWKCADLTGQSLIFRTLTEPYNRPELTDIANITWVRLVPLAGEELEKWEALKPRDDTRNVFYIYCSGILSGHIRGTFNYNPTSLDWFKNEIQPALDSDVRIFNFEAIRGNYCCYKTKIGDVGTEDRSWPDEWVDPLAAFTKVGQENGLKVFAAMRMIGANYPMERYPISWARHFFAHPEWCKLDRDGTPTTSLSIAFPEVRDYWLSLLREARDYGVDGLTVYLHRFHPFVLYEEPTVQSFIDKYGEDPRKLPDDDPRWLEHSAGYLTDFLRQVRALVDEKPGMELAISYYGGPSGYDKRENWEPILYTCDVDTWIREGIPDYLIPVQYPPVHLVKRWADLAQGRVHIWPDLMPRYMPGEEFAKLAKKYYEAGADGMALNDCERRVPRLTEWAVQRHLGHRDQLDRLIEEAPGYYHRTQLKTLWGYATKYSFNNFGLG